MPNAKSMARAAELRAEIRRHCQQDCFAQLLRRPLTGRRSLERRLTFALARMHMYGLLVLSFRLTASREARPDASVAMQR